MVGPSAHSDCCCPTCTNDCCSLRAPVKYCVPRWDRPMKYSDEEILAGLFHDEDSDDQEDRLEVSKPIGYCLRMTCKIGDQKMTWTQTLKPSEPSKSLLMAQEKMKTLKSMIAEAGEGEDLQVAVMRTSEARDEGLRSTNAFNFVNSLIAPKGKRARLGVYNGTYVKTKGGLSKADLMKNKAGKIVSRKRHASGQKAYLRSEIRFWAEAVSRARKILGIKGFVAVGGASAQGKSLHAKAKSLYRFDYSYRQDIRRWAPISQDGPPSILSQGPCAL